jgi:hypothetical protein
VIKIRIIRFTWRGTLSSGGSLTQERPIRNLGLRRLVR